MQNWSCYFKSWERKNQSKKEENAGRRSNKPNDIILEYGR